MACCCLVIASKSDDRPRHSKLMSVKGRELISFTYNQLNNAPLDDKSSEFQRRQEELHANELILLGSLGFELTVEVAHDYLLYVQGDKQLFEYSWLMANNLIASDLSLKYPARQIAAGILLHSQQHKHLKLPSGWLDLLRVSADDFSEEIALKISREIPVFLEMVKGEGSQKPGFNGRKKQRP